MNKLNTSIIVIFSALFFISSSAFAERRYNDNDHHSAYSYNQQHSQHKTKLSAERSHYRQQNHHYRKQNHHSNFGRHHQPKHYGHDYEHHHQPKHYGHGYEHKQVRYSNYYYPSYYAQRIIRNQHALNSGLNIYLRF